MTVQSRAVPSLIQGISQQAPQQRRDTQCEDQLNCFNSPKDGCVARNSLEVIAVLPYDFRKAFFWESVRSSSEKYVGIISGGVLRMYSLITGAQGSVTYEAEYAGYLQYDWDNPQDAFAIQTVDDTTFVASKEMVPAMNTVNLAPTRPTEALLFFKAGNYLTAYIVSVLYLGTVYRFTYQTPDNSVGDNARYINTQQLAATFYRALTGAAATSNSYGAGTFYDGDPVGTVNAKGTGSWAAALTTLGFGVELNGNLIRIWRNDGVDFEVDTADGSGDTHLVAIKDSVRSLTDLPKGGFPGFLVRVRGVAEGEDKSKDFYLEYVNRTGASGYWRERAAPGAQQFFDANTLPHAVVNTAPGQYLVRREEWSARVAGSQDDSARNPYFVGRYIQSLCFHKGRLGILTEGALDFSKARNPYTYFPDTVQVILADAPISFKLSASAGRRSIALLRETVTVNESLYLWADRAQFRVTGGETSEAGGFKQDTADAPQSSSYEFSSAAGFASIGAALYFATQPGNWATIRSLSYNQNGKVAGDQDITAHVPALIPAGVRQIVPSDTGQLLLVRTDGAHGVLYLYNYLVQGQEIVQSAWSKWTAPGQVLWHYVDGSTLYLALYREGLTVLCRMSLDTEVVDNVAGAAYHTRLDLRVDESQVTIGAYNPGTNTTPITIPWVVNLATDPPLVVALRANGVGDSRPYTRGREFPIASVAGTVNVVGDLTGYQFYIGHRIHSEREESPFYLRGEQGVQSPDSLTVTAFKVLHAHTGYYRIEVTKGRGQRIEVAELNLIQLGSGDGGFGAAPVPQDGELSAGIGAASRDTRIRIINDSFLPSRWQSAEYQYEAVYRTPPSGGARGR